MDNIGIKAAVSRAKERKKRLTKLGKVRFSSISAFLICSWTCFQVLYHLVHLGLCLCVSALVCQTEFKPFHIVFMQIVVQTGCGVMATRSQQTDSYKLGFPSTVSNLRAYGKLVVFWWFWLISAV
jgi:hypothetical protein